MLISVNDVQEGRSNGEIDLPPHTASPSIKREHNWNLPHYTNVIRNKDQGSVEEVLLPTLFALQESQEPSWTHTHTSSSFPSTAGELGAHSSDQQPTTIFFQNFSN